MDRVCQETEFNSTCQHVKHITCFQEPVPCSSGTLGGVQDPYCDTRDGPSTEVGGFPSPSKKKRIDVLTQWISPS